MTETISCPRCGAALPADAPSGLCPACLMAAALEINKESVKSVSRDAATTPRAEFVPPEPAWLAPFFPQLEIRELLGHGGMGAVYKARQTKLDRMVALKILRPESSEDPSFAERFHREARTLARLSHASIVAIHDFGEVTVPGHSETDAPAQAIYYFVMEYVEGANLRQLLQSSELRPEQALTIVPQICEALQFAHDAGIVHRDIKPENILVDTRGRVKIADFGLARIISDDLQEATLTGTHQVLGTPRYMAPEQIEGTHTVDHRADIYSLGVVFYEMLTGELPLGRFDPPSRKVTIDSQCDSVVLRALEKDPGKRYQHASEVKSDVERISDFDHPAGAPASGLHDKQASSKSGEVTGDAGQPGLPANTPPASVGLRVNVMKPALALIITGSLSVLVQIGLFVWLFEWWIESYQFLSPNVVGWIVLHLMVIVLAGTIWMIYGAVCLLNFSSLRDAQASAVAALLPLPGLILGLPFGLWILALLSRPEIRGRFKLQSPDYPLWRKAGVILVLVLFLLFLLALVDSAS